MKSFLLLSILIVFFPLGLLACEPDYDVDLYEPYRLSRNLHKIYIDDPNDYYAYFFGDKLSQASFYPAYRYFSGKPLNETNLSENSHFFKCGGNYLGCIETPDDEYSKYDLNTTHTMTYDAAIKWLNRDLQLSSKLNGDQNIDTTLSTDTMQNVSYISSFDTGCYYGTFDNAVALSEKAEQELNNEELAIWLKNQKLILRSCIDDVDTHSYNQKKKIYLDECKTQLEDSEPIQTLEKKEVPLSWWQRIMQFIMKLFGHEEKTASNISATNTAREELTQSVSLTDAPIKFPKSDSEKLNPYLDYQNAIYYFYRASLYGNRCYYQKAQQEFSKIVANKNHPFYALGSLGYVKSLYREIALFNQSHIENDAVEELKKNLLAEINADLANSNLKEIQESLLLIKESLLANYSSKDELATAEKYLIKNAPQNYSHNFAILNQQIELIKNQKLGDDYSEFAKYVTYWNFSATVESISKIRTIYNNSKNKDLWLILLMKKMNEISGGSIDYSLAYQALSSNVNNKYYYPLQYYANLLLLNNNSALAKKNIRRIADDQKTPDIAYDYFSDLAMNNTDDLSVAIEYIKRKNVYAVSPFGIEYSFTRMYNNEIANKWSDYDFGQFRKDTNKDGALLSFLNRYVPIYTLANNKYILSEYSGRLFTRAFVMGEKNLYLKLLPIVAKNDPNIKPALDTNNDLLRDFIITHAILKNIKISASDYYGIVLNNSNHNSESVIVNENDWYLDEDFSGDAVMDNFNKKFLKKDRLDLADKEYRFLAINSIGKVFAEKILNYIKITKDDSRIPEALSNLTKFRKLHSRASDDSFPEKVFKILHFNYPGSVWSELTPYYY